VRHITKKLTKQISNANLMECIDPWCMQQAVRSLQDKSCRWDNLSVARRMGGKKTQRDCEQQMRGVRRECVLFDVVDSIVHYNVCVLCGVVFERAKMHARRGCSVLISTVRCAMPRKCTMATELGFQLGKNSSQDKARVGRCLCDKKTHQDKRFLILCFRGSSNPDRRGMHDRKVWDRSWQRGRAAAMLIAEGRTCRRCCKEWGQCKGLDNKICKTMI
jgi:hypothetical protein